MLSSRAQCYLWSVAGVCQLLMLTGCAKHADFVELRDSISTISKSQEQDHQRVDAALRRLESLERVKDAEPGKARFEEFAARLQKIEARLAKLEEGPGSPVSKLDPVPSEAPKLAKPSKPQAQVESAPIIPSSPGITPTAAFNLAYNDYLNGKYELAVSGFQRFTKDFPGTSLTPNAHYWLGESYYNQKDYARAIQAFEYLVTEYPGNEKVPAALYKLGLATAETGDLVKSRKYLKHVLEEFPSSEEAKLAKNKLADIR
ncbi:MAG: tol-pal system protein YbgF [Nitrospira sp.]|jgi:tol-pal system protein YbgF|nr:tol-pal system protein YbgF [Nitrospira sp.]